MAKGGVIGNLRVNLGLDSAEFQAGLAGASKNMDAMAKKAADFGKRVGVALTAATAAFGAFVKFTADSAAKTGDVADRLGVMVESLQELRHAAEMSGVGVETFDVALRRFIRRSSEAARGTGAAKDAFKELGVSLVDSQKRMRPTEDIFNDVADAMGKIQDPANKLRLAFKMFDTDGAAMVKMFENGSQGIKDFREQAQQLGIVLSEDAVRSSQRFSDSLTLISKAAEGFKNRVFVGVIPAFEQLAARVLDVSMNTQVMDGVVKALSTGMNLLARGLGIVADNFHYVVQAAKLFVAVQVTSVAISMGRALVALATSLRSVGLVMTAVHAVTRLKLKTWLLLAGAIAIVTGNFEALEGTLSTLYDTVGGWLNNMVEPIMGGLINDLSAGIPEAQAALDGLGSSFETVSVAASGAGAKIREQMIASLDQLRESLMTEVEAERNAYAQRLLDIQAFNDAKLISEAEYHDLMERAKQEHADRMTEIERRRVDEEQRIRDMTIDGVASTLGSIGRLIESSGEKGLAAAKAFAIGEAIVNTAVGITQALRLPPPASWAQAAAVAAAGAAQIASIVSARKGGGSRPSVKGGGGSTGSAGSETRQPQQPQQAVTINLQGDVYSRQSVEDLIKEINDAQRDGYAIIHVGA